MDGSVIHPWTVWRHVKSERLTVVIGMASAIALVPVVVCFDLPEQKFFARAESAFLEVFVRVATEL